jgi:hypothetical protein
MQDSLVESSIDVTANFFKAFYEMERLEQGFSLAFSSFSGLFFKSCCVEN